MPRLALVAALAALAGCAAAPSAPPAEAAPQSAAFVTRLGDDTLAVERFTQTATGMEATVALRAPRTTLTTYRLDLDGGGGLVGYSALTRDPATGAVLRRETAEPQGDSVRVTVAAADREPQTRVVFGGDRPLPFIDMVHWPFELMTERAVAAGGALAQPLFTPRGSVAFTSDVAADGAVEVRHPFRGPMAVTATPSGGLASLDAAETTRKVVVTRVPDVNVEALAADFAARDAAGRSFGDLSGRGETVAEVGGATVTVDYGRPQMRGREVWGALVPWGEVWRTGANRATHLTTDRTLAFDPDGEVPLVVPPGTYTLFTIPEADGGLLIVNRQTGQGGTGYDPAQDLGRARLVRPPLHRTYEAFTVEVVEIGPDAGRLDLLWARRGLTIPFRVLD